MSHVQHDVNQCRCVWLTDTVLRSMEDEASFHSPHETGGALLGYWGQGRREAVVTHTVGAGSKAEHSKVHFVPDYDFQETEIARLYESSNRQLQYLGDWHSHPGGSGTLSFLDRKTLRSIGQAREARVPEPIMVVLAGGPGWTVHGWQGGSVGWWYFRCAIAREVPVRTFSAGPKIEGSGNVR